MQSDRQSIGSVAHAGALTVDEDAVPVPEGLRWLAPLSGGGAWLSKLPQLVAGCVRDWRLTVHAPIQPGSVSWVAHAELPDGTPAVLKLSFPDEETRHEPDALSLWAGRGAVRLHDYDRARHAMLLERCIPGVQLWSIPDEDAANQIAADILRRLWRPPPAAAPFRLLADDARRWSRELPVRYRRHGRPFARRLLDETRSLCVELAASQREAVVCHQDFHSGNVLSAERRWLAIDPKPLVGERAFDLASLLRDRRDRLLSAPAPRRVIRRRLDLLSSELGMERERARLGHCSRDRLGAHRRGRIRAEHRLRGAAGRVLTVRRLRKGEGARLRELRLRALAEAPYAFATSLDAAEARSGEQWEDFALKSEAAETQVTFLVATDQVWLGMASAFLDRDEPHTAQLVQMWVDPESRGLGLGRRLVEAVAEWARQRGVIRLKASVTDGNHAAEALYENVGFLPTGDRRPLGSNPSLTEIVLARDLSRRSA